MSPEPSLVIIILHSYQKSPNLQEIPFSID